MSIKLQASSHPGRRPPALVAAGCILVGVSFAAIALWSVFGGGGKGAVAAPPPGTERLVELAASGREEAARRAQDLRQKDIGDNYKIDEDGNLVSAADMDDVPQNRTFGSANPKPAEEAIAEVRREMRRPAEDPPPPAPRTPEGEGGERPATMLGYSTVRGASWATRQVDVGAEAVKRDDKGVPRGGDPGGSEDRVLKVMEDAVRAQAGGVGAAAAAPRFAAGASGRGEMLYPALQEAQDMRQGGVGDMRIGGVGPDQVVRQGKFLDCALINHLRVDLAESEVLAMVSRDFVSLDGRYVLIPAGSKLLGTAGTVQNVQQARVYLKFDRIIFPDQRSAYFPVRRVG